MKCVIKIGGAVSAELDHLAQNLKLLKKEHQIVVVHGGSADTSTLLRQLNVEDRRLTAPDGVTTRYTTPEALDVLVMAMRGRTQRRILAALARAGIDAVGLSGADGRTVTAERKTAVRNVVDGRNVLVRDNLAGRITTIRTEVLDALIQTDCLPLVCPPAITPAGEVVNVDADRLAAALAAAWGADQLILLTEVAGLLDEGGNLVANFSTRETGSMPSSIKGGMRMKLHAATHAREHGVERVIIATAHGENPISDALAGKGTVID